MSVAQSRTYIWLLGCLVVLTACVTINIYFPAAAAEKAADEIIRDVWQEQPDGAPPPSAVPDQESLQDPATAALAWRAKLLDFFITPARAQADIDIDTPAINRLKNSMTNRHRQLSAYYDSGAVGLTQAGFLAVRDLTAVPLNRRNTVQQLVQQENNDRRALYKEIAQANGHPEWEDDIRATFARQWISNARGGWWYQSGSSWTQK